MECHEIWDYLIQPVGNTQRLRYLIALCPSCHEVKHFGRAEITGRREEALQHLALVNEWGLEQTLWYLGNIAAVWEARSDLEWVLDLQWIERQFDIHLHTSRP